MKVRENLHIGVALRPVNRPKIPDSLPRSWEVGIGLQAIAEQPVVAVVQAVSDSAVQIRAGMHAQNRGQLGIRRTERLSINLRDSIDTPPILWYYAANFLERKIHYGKRNRGW